MSSNGVDLAQYEQKILLIEDDQTLQELYKELLEDAGFTVQVAKDGDEGLSGLMKGGYALVLLDVMLPRKDGIAILKEMKKSKSLQPNGPIVLLTNLGNDEVIKQCFQLGATGYLIKSSLAPDQVVSEVRTFLRNAAENT
ncbi:MAG TPA: response regulator [Patescibacteria group bacterium]|nr:response regulator [Patescibacteria group bacterium]